MAYKVARVEKEAIADFAAFTASPTTATVPVEILKTTTGTVTLAQKIQGYYKAVVFAVGTIAGILVEVGPLADLLPPDQRKYYAGAVSAVTLISAILVKNQTWVNDL